MNKCKIRQNLVNMKYEVELISLFPVLENNQEAADPTRGQSLNFDRQCLQQCPEITTAGLAIVFSCE